jgi:hypothetical protein
MINNEAETFDTVEKLIDDSASPLEINECSSPQEMNEQPAESASKSTLELKIIDRDPNQIMSVVETDSFDVVLDKLEQLVGHRRTFEFSYQNSWFIVDDEDTFEAFLEWVESESNGEAEIRTVETNWREVSKGKKQKQKSKSNPFEKLLWPAKTALLFLGVSSGGQRSSNLFFTAGSELCASAIVSCLAYFFIDFGLYKASGYSFPSDQSQLGAISGLIAAPLFLSTLFCGDVSTSVGRLECGDCVYIRDPKLGYPDCFSLQLLRVIVCGLVGIPTSIACIVIFCLRNEVVHVTPVWVPVRYRSNCHDGLAAWVHPGVPSVGACELALHVVPLQGPLPARALPVLLPQHRSGCRPLMLTQAAAPHSIRHTLQTSGRVLHAA